MTNERLYEAIGDIDEKKVKEAKEMKKAKKPVWRKWGAIAACLCLVAIVAFASPMLQGEQGGAGPQLGVVPQPSGTPGIETSQPGNDQETTQPGNDQETTQPERMNLLVVNEVESFMSADMDVQISHYNDISAAEWETVLKAFENAIGLRYEDFTARIPDAFESKSFYSLDTPADAVRTEYIPHDYVFVYQSESGGEAVIAVCAAAEPLRDCIISCDDPERSEINGVTVEIYGYRDSFMVRFSYENVNYDIGTGNITLEELEELLTGIIFR